jgi:RecA-family ATPase
MSFAAEAEIEGLFTDLGEAVLSPPEWVIENLLPVGITFMVGPPKTLKSTIEMALSMLVSGQQCEVLPPEMSRVPETGRVIGLSAEASAGELRFMVERGFGTKVAANGMIQIADDPWRFRLDDPNGLDTLLGILNRVRPRLLWVDPLRDFHGEDEQDSGPMQRLLRPVQRWAKVNRAALLVVHHTRKLGSGEDRNLKAQDARGTSALFGLADGLITLTPKGENTVHFDVVTKRGMPWEKTVKLKVWGSQGNAVSLVDTTAREVFALLVITPTLTQRELAQKMNLSVSVVNKKVADLKALGALDPDGKPVTDGEKLVAAAMKTHKIHKET